MSSVTNQSSRIISASYIYKLILKWPLKAKDFRLKTLQEGSSDTSVIKSGIYEFKTVKDFGVFLEITRNNYQSSISIHGSEGWSFKLFYAFLVSKDGVFSLKKSKKKLSFLQSFQSSAVSDEEDVTIHCAVRAIYTNSVSSDQQTDVSEMEGQSMMCFKSMLDTTLPSDYTNQMVIDFIQKGVLPDLTVTKAIEIIGQTEVHNCEVLKTLCVQYLKNNINEQTISQILRAAMDLGLPILERICVKEIADGSYELRKRQKGFGYYRGADEPIINSLSIKEEAEIESSDSEDF